MLIDILIRLAVLIYRLIALWNPKAKLWVDGRKDIFQRMAIQIDRDDRVIWFHAASLGEFEEGRPLIEKTRQQHPDHKILLTFYSPSGYEVRKNYDQVDWVFYLPADTRSNVTKLLDIVHPEIVIFIKYEFWPNLLSEIKKRSIRAFVVSARFIPNSRFFRWYGSLFRKSLRSFETIFVQDKRSVSLMQSIGINKVVLAGDPRFDRVSTIAKAPFNDKIIERFKQNDKIFIAGSTCGKEDDELIQQLINLHPDTKFIVVPHDLDPKPIEKYIENTHNEVKVYTNCDYTTNFDNTQVLIVNTIGMLAKLYRYGNWAFIGGGFIAGIHSVIEATVYGVPAVFGPNYHKNRPGKDMVALGGCGSVKNIDELNQWFMTTKRDEENLQKISTIVYNYTHENMGATDFILKEIWC